MRFRHVFLVILGCCVFSCQREQVTLALDFGQASSWRYRLEVFVSGTVRITDSVRVFSNGLNTILQGERLGDTDGVLFRASGTAITSDCMSEPERINLERESGRATFRFSPDESQIESSDTSVIPKVNFGGWDFVRSFARVLPVLPEKPVRIRSSWERERAIPLETSVGKAVGSLYQNYTLDSVVMRNDSRCAFVSWEFSYRINPSAMDSLSLLDRFPLTGRGKGSTVIDITHRTMLGAYVIFAVSAVPGAPVQISWQESARCDIIK